jgi:hypothetical protein
MCSVSMARVKRCKTDSIVDTKCLASKSAEKRGKETDEVVGYPFAACARQVIATPPPALLKREAENGSNAICYPERIRI